MNGCGQTFEFMNRMEILVARENRITWEEGIPHADRKTDFVIRGLIVPLTGKELLLVPEGDRYRYNTWVYTQGELRDNDLVIYAGQPFEVQVVTDWGSYRQARAMRLDVGVVGES